MWSVGLSRVGAANFHGRHMSWKGVRSCPAHAMYGKIDERLVDHSWTQRDVDKAGRGDGAPVHLYNSDSIDNKAE